MKRHFSPRWVLAIGLIALWFGALQAAGKSPAAMATAADAFLKSLTPEQRQQASFPVQDDEWTHWHFIPTEVREGPKKGLRILAAEEDSARALFVALAPALQKQSLINVEAPGDIVTTNKVQVDPLSPTGVAAGALDARQRDLLMKVVDSYVSLMASDIAEDR